MGCKELAMSYLDALSSSCFKTGADGRHLFFPYGMVGGGYVLRSQHEYEQLRGKMNGWIVGMLAAGFTVPFPWVAFPVSALIVLVVILSYVAWVRAVTRGLARTAEPMTLSESLAAQAHRHNIVVLWLLQLGSLALVGCGLLLLIVDPRQWLVALLAVSFFGFCAWGFARMLIARRKAVPVP